MTAQRARLLAATAAAAVLAATLSGCVTVHGETAVVPALSRGEAAKVLQKFTAQRNKANREYSAKLNSAVETGAVGAIDNARLRAMHARNPDGAKKATPMTMKDARFLIPRQAGWPKFFVADARSNGANGGHLLTLFQRSSAGAPWKASYMAPLGEKVPKFATDGEGYAKPVAAGRPSRLTVPPERMSEEYVRYLQDGSGDFADGPQTSEWRDQRKKNTYQGENRYDFSDQPARPPQYTSFGLRTKDGGAVVFFSSHHYTRVTGPRGRPPQVTNPLVRELLQGKVKQRVTYTYASQQSVAVPAQHSGGKTRFLSRTIDMTEANGS